MAQEQEQTSSPPIYKICIQGCMGSGKTSLAIRFVYDKDNTGRLKRHGDIFQKTIHVDGGDVQLIILDSPQKGHDPQQWRSFLDQGDGFLLVFTITSEASFNALADYRDEIVKVKGPNTPIILVGNMCDLEDKRMVSTADGSGLAKQWGVGYLETSATSPLNVDLLFTVMARKIASQKAKHPNEPHERTHSCPCCEIL